MFGIRVPRKILRNISRNNILCCALIHFMMSRTVRYFKMMYIVAGILLSNEEVCETVDQIQITPRVEVKDLAQPKKLQRKEEKVSKTPKTWYQKMDVFLLLPKLKRVLTPMLGAFSIWTIPKLVLDYSSGYISKKFVLDGDCDMIYNK
ncbi:uncharacterized protein LOC119673173 [Teleopsis dalmanni]|uniref:uncharacterized protein LOC119672812 n=1 Tax=Teleopsis dalmanni TaxID=139649 RepID=UPI0018CD8D12|nr:uncharacterized protein LOC119672812 [Teleopsis dalmanni]XP_037940339.1 uncharacterized protein LOC119673172 [Teleopsis dalmanni]XP_037940340.1 uncharacterized protein LOC119673173 [Teleopsis dalmanni]